MATGPPSANTTDPPSASKASNHSETARAVAVTVVAAGVVIGVLAGLPAHSPRSAPPTTAAPHSSTTTTTTTVATRKKSATPTIKVAILAPAGSTAEATVRDKLASAHYTLLTEAPIPPDWVSSLSAPQVEYPPGLAASAAKVATALGQHPGAITPEQAGSSKGADVVEVFVPSS